MDALNRDAGMDLAMEALHQMVDILIAGQPDRSSIPLSLQALHIAAQRRQKDPDAWHHLALVARRLGDLQTAITAFNQAFNLAPNSMPVATNFIQTLRRAGDRDNALKVAKFAVENGNESPVVLALLAPGVPEEAVTARAAQLELLGLADQLLGQRKLHRATSPVRVSPRSPSPIRSPRRLPSSPRSPPRRHA